jgi:hypothetical protein
VKIYLAGPMSGYPEWNFSAFFKAEKELIRNGHTVFNPAAEDIRKWGTMENIAKHANYRDCMRTDLNWILDHAEGIALLSGWEKSKGAQIELALAKLLNLKEIYLIDSNIA